MAGESKDFRAAFRAGAEPTMCVSAGPATSPCDTRLPLSPPDGILLADYSRPRSFAEGLRAAPTHPRVQEDSSGARRRSSVVTFGHSRKVTDPFVDQVTERKAVDTPASTPEPTYPHKHQLRVSGNRPVSMGASAPPQSFSRGPAGHRSFTSTDVPTYLPGLGPSQLSDSNHSRSSSYYFQPRERNVSQPSPKKAAPTPPVDPLPFINTHREELPIPPPIFPSVAARLSHSPNSRAHLDSRTATRVDWIRTEAKKVAAAARLARHMEARYQETKDPGDHAVWCAAKAKFAELTDPDKRHQERRELFAPKGETALRMAVKDAVEQDVKEGFPANPGSYMKNKEGEALLDFRMAFMERQCWEVKARHEEGSEDQTLDVQTETAVQPDVETPRGRQRCRETGDEEITPEEYAVMTLSEKRELKKILAERIRDGWRP